MFSAKKKNEQIKMKLKEILIININLIKNHEN